MKVVKAVATAPTKTLNEQHKSGFESLIKSLEDRLRAGAREQTQVREQAVKRFGAMCAHTLNVLLTP